MKIVASLKTIPGREQACEAAADSLRSQVDQLYIIREHPGSNGDADKFIGLYRERAENPEPFLFLSCDDDLIYPPDYARFMELAVTTYPGIVSCHGRKFTTDRVGSYYKSGIKYHCLHDVVGVHQVDCGGTGVMAFLSTTCDTLTESDFPRNYPLMADIHMGIWARRNGIPIRVLPHSAGWIQAHPSVKDDETIWGKHHQSDRLQTEKANELLSIIPVL